MKLRSWFVCAAILVFGASMSVGAESSAKNKGEWARVYEKCKGSIMQVEITRQVDGNSSTAMGSAFIITEDGYALTNTHVMGDGLGDRKVIFHDGKSYPFTITETGKTIDVALIKIETRDADVKFTPLKIGRSNKLRGGQAVAALGNPGGRGLTVSSGTISGLNRGSEYQWGGAATWRDDMIQTDARITSGSSGGALINTRGEVIGLVCNLRAWADRVSFAIPIDEVVKALPGIVKVEDRNDFVTGLVVDPLTRPRIAEVAEGSPGEAAGLRPRDVIVAINGKKMVTGMDYCITLLGCAPGQELALTIRRNGRISKKKLKLERVKPIPSVEIEGLARGLSFKFHGTAYGKVLDFEKLDPDETGTADVFRIDAYAGRDGFAMQFDGYVRVPREGKYTFYTNSDDGSVLFIGDRLVVDNNGLHAPFEQGGVVTLAAGLHPIRVGYAEAAGSETLAVSYQGPGVAKQVIPASALFRIAGPGDEVVTTGVTK